MKIDNNYFTRKDVNLSSKVFWLFLWLGGLFYTGRIIVNSSKRYLRYPAQIYEREGDAGKLAFSFKNFQIFLNFYNQAITFPKILVCSNSMHSRYKLQVFYPQLNSSMIEKFYGNYDEINSIKKLDILNLIKENVSLHCNDCAELSQFFRDWKTCKHQIGMISIY